jgi:protein O-GlcNAc transferase
MSQMMSHPRLRQAAQHLDNGQPAQAKMLLAQVLAKTPADWHALRMMRHALNRLGEHQAALYYAERAKNLQPDDPDALNLYGNSLLEVGRMEDAEAALRRAVEINPSHELNMAALANIVSLRGHYIEAMRICEKGLQDYSTSPGLTGVLGNVLMHTGQAERTVEVLKRGLANDPTNLGRLSMLCMALNYLPGATPAEITAAHCAYGRMLAMQVPVPPESHPNPLDPERPLRVGFVSGDLRAHAVAFFAEPVLERLSKEHFHVYAYQTMAQEDGVSARLKKIPGLHWLNTSKISPIQIAQRIRQDKIDILIDLAGHTIGNALPVFHLRPAPVQASWLGYLCTTGMDAIAWKIMDAQGAPADAQRYTVEKLLPIDPTACCYRPAKDVPDIGPPPSVQAGHITFGSFSFSSKLNDSVLRVWARVVNQVRGSKLLIKNTGLKDAEFRDHLADRLARAGISRDRLEILGPTPDVRSHLEMYNRVDVALDTFPWPGITTVCDALTMGVPIVSLVGATALSRSCTPMLTAAGLHDLIVESEDAYVAAAAACAADVPRRAALRQNLRHTFLASPICDEPGFARKFEGALRAMWRDHCAAKAAHK